MLRWRLLLGAVLIAVLAGLGWLDCLTSRPAIWFPVLLILCLLGSSELVRLAEAGGMHPVPWVVYAGNLLLVTSNWLPQWLPGDLLGLSQPDALGRQDPGASSVCLLLAFGAGLFLAFVGEMSRYRKPGGVTVNLAAAVFALTYIGLLLSFVVQLRLLWGIGSLVSLLIVAKMGDIGAYTVGRLIGRHKMAPVLSPKKTIEGAVGGVIFSCAASWATFHWILPILNPNPASPGPRWGWLFFGVTVCIAGMLGDLAESLIKRDVQCKDSSTWLPGFGGVLDLLDSVLLAAPVAYACWSCGVAGG